MKIYKITEASEYLGVSINTLKTLANNGKIKSFKTTGEHRRFRQEDLDAYMGVEKEKQEKFTSKNGSYGGDEEGLQEELDLTNMTVEEARDALRKGLCERVYCKKWSADYDEEWVRYEASTDTFMYCKVIEGRYSEERVFGAMDNESGWSKGTLKDEK